MIDLADGAAASKACERASAAESSTGWVALQRAPTLGGP